MKCKLGEYISEEFRPLDQFDELIIEVMQDTILRLAENGYLREDKIDVQKLIKWIKD